MESAQTTPHDYRIVRTADELRAMIAEIRRYPEFCFDTETTGFDLFNDRIVGMSFAVVPHEAWYVPCDERSTPEYAGLLRPLFEDETIAKIAERNLTKKAKKRIEKYLGGHSIVYFAKWMDEYRHTPEYKFTNNWHTAPVNAELRYEDSMLAKNGNAIYGLEQAIENLKNYRSLTDSAVEVNLKYIIHLVGDMHCPAHIKYTTHDMKYDVLFEDKYHKPHKFPIHSVWDNEIITTTRIWSVSEWADELDRLPKAERQAVAAGTPRDWLHDNAVVCEAQFEWAKPGQRLGQDFLNEALPLIERQIRNAGYRLARVLNELFG